MSEVSPLFADTAVTASPTPSAGLSPVQPAPPPLPAGDDYSAFSPAAVAQKTGAANAARQLLEQHKSSSLGDLGKQLNTLVETARGLSAPAPGQAPHHSGLFGLTGLMSKFRSEKEQLLAHTQSIETRIQGLTKALQGGIALERQHIGILDAMSAQNRQGKLAFQEGLRRCEAWIPQAEARAAAAPTPEERVTWQNRVNQMKTWREDFANASTLADNQAVSLEAEKQVSRNSVDACERVISFTIPALEQVAAQQVMLLEQQATLGAAQAGKDAFAAALKSSSELLGQNLVASSEAAGQSVFDVGALSEAQKVLDAALAQVSENTKKQEMQRQLDAQTRAQMAAQYQRLGMSS